MYRFFLHPLSDPPHACQFRSFDPALVLGAFFPWPWLIVRRARSRRGNMCSLLGGGWRGKRNKGCRGCPIKGAPQRASSAAGEETLAGYHRAQRRGKGAGPRSPRAGCGARTAARPFGAELGECSPRAGPGEPGGGRWPARTAEAGCARGRRVSHGRSSTFTGTRPGSPSGVLPRACCRLPFSEAFRRYAAPRREATPAWDVPGAAGASG